MGLREQAKLDARAILEDTSGFAWPILLTSPLGVVTSVYGFSTDVAQTIDPETGQAVAGQRASVAIARGALPELPEAVAESARKPWLATFADSEGVQGAWKVVEVLPDRAAGVVVLLLEVFKRAIVHLTGALALPMLQLAGTVDPAVELGGDLELPSGLELAGEIAPAVELGGDLELPSLELDGTVAPVVGDLVGALTLPSLELDGTVAPVVGDLVGALTLPSGLALSGTIAPAVELGGSLALPMLTLSGTITPAVELGGSLALPMLTLSGTITPAVELGGSLALPMIQLSGSLTMDTNAIAAMLDLETATSVSGAWSSIPDLFASNPAVQGTAGQRPLVATSANSLPLADNQGGDDVMSWPVASNNNQTVTWGLGFWIQFDTVTGVNGMSSAIPGANNKYEYFITGGQIGFDAYTSQFASRRGISAAATVTTGVWYFVTLEYDGGASGDAGRCTMTLDGTPLSLTFSNSSGTPPGSVMPATLKSASGDIAVGARNGAGLSAFNGRWGPKFYVFGAKLSGVTEGLLTAAARAAIKAYKQPT